MTAEIRFKTGHNPEGFNASRYAVTLFRSCGTYPRGTFAMPTGLLHADDDIVFAVTYGRRWKANLDDLPYSEVDWLEPELIRLLGALMMTEQFAGGIRCRFYPIPDSGRVIDAESFDLMQPGAAEAVKSALLRAPVSRGVVTLEECRKSVGWQKGFLFETDELSIEEFPAYWQGTNTADHVLLRGIQVLIKSDMLAMHQEFMEEATMATFIALEASFQLVRRHLQAMGNPNPSSADAGKWLYETFDEPMGAWASEGRRYFDEFYDQRIQTVHPASRFGDIPYAPVMVDDWIHLRQALPGIFAYLVLGRHSAFFHRRVEEERGRRERPTTKCESCDDD